jgi:Ca-activated chloride channel family protein
MGVLSLMIAWSLRPSRARHRLAPVLALLVLGLGESSVRAESDGAPPIWASLFGRHKVQPEEAESAQKKGHHKLAAELFGKLVKDNPPSLLRHRYAQAMGYSAHQIQDYDRAIGAFSQALESEEHPVQTQAHQGMAHSLYDQGDRALAKQPKFTLKNWRDSVKHFDAAIKLDPANERLRENREFVQKRLEELQKQIEQEEQKGDKGDKGDKKKGQKGEGEEGEDGDEDGEQDGDGKNDKAPSCQ